MLVSNVDTGERLAVPTSVCAARWKTLSTSYSFSARAIRPSVQMSPWTTSTAPSRPSSRSGETAG